MGIYTEESIRDAVIHRKTQPEVAKIYAELIFSSNNGNTRPDWPSVNRVISDRWPKGLLRVKRMAWSILKSRGYSFGK